MKKIEPVAYMTYKGYLLHAKDPKVKEHSEPAPLWTDDALQSVADAVLKSVAEVEGHSLTEWKESIDIDAIINKLKGE